MFDTVMKGIMSAMLPTAVSVLADNMDSFRTFLRDQAAKTDNKLDDALVEIVVDWLEKYLESLK